MLYVDFKAHLIRKMSLQIQFVQHTNAHRENVIAIHQS